MEQTERQLFVDRETRRIETRLRKAQLLFPLNPIPEPLFQTMLAFTDPRDDPQAALERLMQSRVFEATVCTFSFNQLFPVNTARKFVYPTPHDGVLEEVIDDLEGQLLSFQGRPLDDTLGERFELFRNLYIDEERLDRFRLGALEIYGDLTYRNIVRDPRVSLNMRWDEGTSLKSVQLNCIAEIVGKSTPFYRFIRVVRSLFSQHFVDLLGYEYTCAYKFWICESFNKHLSDRHGFRPSVRTSD